MEKKRRKLTQCPNCNYTFEDVNNYCPNCGQENHDLNVPVKHLFLEFLEGTIHFDAKVFKTTRYLLFKPGYLTERFNLGHRMSYVPPFRLYVFISIVFFFVLALSSPNTIKINEDVHATAQAGFHISTPIPDSVGVANAAGLAVQSEEEKFITDLTRKLDGKEEQSRQKIFKSLSFMMFLLMPFFAMILYLFYRKKGRNYVEHLMFSIHLHTFYFILLLAAMLLTKVFPALELGGIVILLMILYLFLALHRVYKQSYGATLLHLIPVSLIYMITLVTFLVSTVIASLMLT